MHALSVKSRLARAFPGCHFLAMSDSIRADKWLWATRFYKTRALAGEVLGNGKLKRNGHVLKSSSSIQVGDLLEIPFLEGPGLRETQALTTRLRSGRTVFWLLQSSGAVVAELHRQSSRQ